MARYKSDRVCLKCWQTKPLDAFARGRSRKCDECKRVDDQRTCERCGETRPSGDYVRRGRLCSECRADGSPCYFRTCFRCFETKPPRAFPLGLSLRHHRHVCIVCTEREATEREARRAAWRATWTDEESGRLVRRCRKCGDVKDLETEFYNCKSTPGLTMAQSRHYRCKVCQGQEGRRIWVRDGNDPEEVERRREKWREYARRERAEHPERVRANQARWEEKLRNDPARVVEVRENHRINYRLRQEQMGKAVTRIIRPAQDTTQFGRLPAAPLAAAVDRIIKLEEVGNLYDDLPIDPNDRSGSRADTVCTRLGIPLRTLFAWRVGERDYVQFMIADRVLTRAGLLWWDVWNEDTVPDPAVLALVAETFGETEGAAA